MITSWFGGSGKSFVFGLLLGVVSVGSSVGHLEAAAVPTAQPNAFRAGNSEPVVAGREQRLLLSNGQQLKLASDGSSLSVGAANGSGMRRAYRLPEHRVNPSVVLLPSGRVLIWGGADLQGQLLRDGLWFNPRTQTLEPAHDLTLSPRAGHSATVLSDGRVLFAGGKTNDSKLGAELWDEVSNRALSLSEETFIDRMQHSASLQADGRVRLLGGRDSNGRVAAGELVFGATEGRFTHEARAGVDREPAGLAGSMPVQGDQEVLPEQRLSVRFTQPVRMADLTTEKVILVGPGGAVPITVAPVENGRLVFIDPERSLFPGSHYTLLIDGVRTALGQLQPLVAIDFGTATLDASGQKNPVLPAEADQDDATHAVTGVNGGKDGCKQDQSGYQPCRAHGLVEDGVWYPGRDNTDSRWRIYGESLAGEKSEYASRSAARHKLTAIRGRVVRVDQMPVANVEVSVGSTTARTNAHGWFALFDVPSGHQELYVDGSTANHSGEEYGQFVVGVEVKQGQLNELPYLMHLPKISARDKIRIPSPLQQDMVVGHPDIPGLELHIPKGTVIHDRKGRLVNELAIVPTPVNRAPFPVMENHPMAFTVEPGAAQVRGLVPNATNGIRVYYPNYDGYKAGTEANFWIYDPTEGWRVYGRGNVSEDGRHFVPERGVALHQTMGGMFSVPGNDPPSEWGLAPDNSGECGCSGDAAIAGDPIDLKTGEFTHAETDVVISDIVPITISRNYRPHDLKRREFGIGMSWNWGYTLNRPDTTNYEVMDLVLPNGSSVRFDRISGSGNQGEWRQAGSNTRFAGALLKTVFDSDPTQPWGRAFLLTLRDGSRMQFSSWNDIRVRWIEDRYGNRTTLAYTAGLVSNIISPSGRSVAIEYDTSNRVKTLRDHTGRQWSYGYDANGLLSKATYPDATFKQYNFQARLQGSALAQHRIESIVNQRGHRLLLNEFEVVSGVSTGRVIRQTQADGGKISIDYAHVVDGVSGTLVTEPDGSKRRIVFDAATPYPASETSAYGTARAQTVTYQRNSYGQLTASVDPLGRRIEYVYNADGQTTQVTSLPGTPKARVVRMTYNADGDLATITDPLNRVTRLTYANRCVASVTDPLNRVATFQCNAAGQLVKSTDPLQRSQQLHYEGYDLVGVTDPLGRTIRFRHDSLGRLIATEDPSGNVTRREYDAMGRVKRVIDAQGSAIDYGFDANGNVDAVLLPNGNGITYTYDQRDRLLTRTDATGLVESWTYDLADRVKTHTDRMKRVVSFVYDELGRATTTTYQDGNTITATYDAGNRLRTLADTAAAGALSWDYDDYDAVIAASTPQGNVTYVYDLVGRRKEMLAAAQPKVDYTYDDADRLRRIAQGTETVLFDYDDVDRLSLATLPNGVAVAHTYDNADQLTGLAWQKAGQASIGSLGYGYNSLGQIVAQTGSFSSQALPASSTGTNGFDDANRQLSHNSQALTYDSNGNLLSDGTRTYVWNVRDQLVQIKQGTTSVASFGYDALGRRYSKTESGATTSYLYDGQNAVQEKVGTTVNPILTGLGIDQRFARNDANGRMYYLTDNLGSTRALTNAEGAVVRRYDYTPYGQAQATGGSSDNPYQYTGRELDKSGLQYYRARYYSPEMGRFISEDSYGFAGGDANFYAYALGNPVSFNDPSGHVAWLAIPVIWAVVEAGLSVYDAYDTGKTLMDPCASTNTKALTASMFAAGIFLPGGGYGVGAKQVDQYALRAVQDGWYPIMTRGQKYPTGQTWLNQGEVWKFGTSKNVPTRYSQSYLDSIGTGGVRIDPEFSGTLGEALMLERMKIDNAVHQSGSLPPGNKIRR